jgi:hypothetical protein
MAERVRVGGGLKGCESWEKISVEQPLIKQEAQTIGRMRVCAGNEHDHASGLRHGPSIPGLPEWAGGRLFGRGMPAEGRCACCSCTHLGIQAVLMGNA